MGVNHGQYLLTRNVSRLIDPKDLGGFCRAADDVGGSVPLVGEHPSRLRRQLKPFFALSQCLVSPFSLGDITGDFGSAHHPASCILNRGNSQGDIHSLPCLRNSNRFKVFDAPAGPQPLKNLVLLIP